MQCDAQINNFLYRRYVFSTVYMVYGVGFYYQC